MRINIKTGFTVRDRDVKALVLLDHAMKISTPRMREANLKFIADKWKFIQPQREGFEERLRRLGVT